LDYHAMATFTAGPPTLEELPAAIQNISGFRKNLPDVRRHADDAKSVGMTSSR
jgi:hypothetical protein